MKLLVGTRSAIIATQTAAAAHFKTFVLSGIGTGHTVDSGDFGGRVGATFTNDTCGTLTVIFGLGVAAGREAVDLTVLVRGADAAVVPPGMASKSWVV